MESALERLSKELESPEPFRLDACKRLISLTVTVDTRCAGMYDSVQEIFKDSDVVVSPYRRTTEGTSTMLVKPLPNLVEEIRKEREQKQKAKTLREEQDEILKQVMIQSEKEPKTEEEMMEEAIRRSLVEQNDEESLLQQVMIESCKQK